MVSQLLTLFTTPVVYLYLDRFRLRWRERWRRWTEAPARGAAEQQPKTA
jgi:multidrug efflux pump